jgi:hypothetical protein
MKVTIYGERCSGTNYLEELLLLNFDVEIVWDYGWKHFFGFHDLSNTDNVCFIGIIRNLHDWINSFFEKQFHLPDHLKDKKAFLNQEIYSLHADETENMTDRHIETKKRYKNIFELRHVKNRFLVDTMPTLVKNYCLITYDELLNQFTATMNKLAKYLPIKTKMPMNISYYKKKKELPYVKKEFNEIDIDTLLQKANLYYEKKLFKSLKG